VTLNNYEFIQNLGLSIGDNIEVVRANQVIPKVIRVSGHTELVTLITPPTVCPICNSTIELQRNYDGSESKYHVCPNEYCSAKLVRSILSWLNAHNSLGVSEKTIQTLFDEGIITSFDDFLSLDRMKDDIINLDGFSIKRYDNLISEIKKTFDTDIITFMKGLHIHHFGRRMFQKIYDVYTGRGINHFLMFCMNVNFISKLEGFSEESAKYLCEEINKRLDLCTDLLKYVSVKPKPVVNISDISLKLDGMSFCFTGKLYRMNRKEAETLVNDNGGEVKSVTKNLTYLVTNDTTSGTSKNKKAQSLGVKLITEDEFLDLLK
jgi:DNA ligase (NAD+)